MEGVDILPTARSRGIPGGDPSVFALHRVLPYSAVAMLGLTLPPRAVTACPAARKILPRLHVRRKKGGKAALLPTAKAGGLRAAAIG